MALPIRSMALIEALRTARASSAWYFDENGDFVESPVVNQLPYSEDLSQSAWAKVNVDLGATRQVDVVSDSVARRVKLTRVSADATSGSHVLNDTVTVTSGVVATLSGFVEVVEATDARYIQLQVRDSSSPGDRTDVTFDLLAGSISTAAANKGTATDADASIEDANNGVYRISLTGAVPSVSSYQVVLTFIDSDGSTQTFVGSGEAIDMGGFQLEEASAPTDYVYTDGAASGRPRIDYDPATGNRLGLASEGASTNLLTYSEDLSNAAWTKANVTIGTSTTFATNISLDEVIESAVNSTHYVGQVSGTVTSGAAATFSGFVKNNGADKILLRILNGSDYYQVRFDLTTGEFIADSTNGTATDTNYSIVDMGGGVYRVSATVSVSGATDYTGRLYLIRNGTSYLGDGSSGVYAGGFQLEELLGASSYIPTAGSQVTRAAETHELVSLDPWYRASGYSVAVQVRLRNVTSNQALLALHDGDSQNSVTVDLLGSASDPRVIVETGNVAQATIQSADAVSAYADFKVAARIAANDFAASIDGNTAITDASGSLPPPATTAVLGQSADDTLPMYGWIQDIKYTTELWSDATLATESGTTV